MVIYCRSLTLNKQSGLGQTHATRDVEANTETARRCVRNSLMRGEAPIASHLLYTQPGILHEPRKPIFERTSICGAMGHEPTLPLSRVSELKARHLSPWRTHFSGWLGGVLCDCLANESWKPALKSAAILERFSLYSSSHASLQNWWPKYLLRVSPKGPQQKSHLVFMTVSVF